MGELTLFYITCPSRDEARRIAKHLLSRHIIACANIFPIESVYWWNGKIENGDECVLIAKTLREYSGSVEKEVIGVHPYKVPCILKFDASSNEGFSSYIRGEVTGGNDRKLQRKPFAVL